MYANGTCTQITVHEFWGLCDSVRMFGTAREDWTTVDLRLVGPTGRSLPSDLTVEDEPDPKK